MKETIRMNQLAGLITEGQARKMMAVLRENDKNILNKIEQFIQTNTEAGNEDDNMVYEFDINELGGDILSYLKTKDRVDVIVNGQDSVMYLSNGKVMVEFN
jgi:hypothetical protein